MRETKKREGMKGDGDRVSRTGLKRLKIRKKEEKRGRKRKRVKVRMDRKIIPLPSDSQDFLQWDKISRKWLDG